MRLLRLRLFRCQLRRAGAYFRPFRSPLKTTRDAFQLASVQLAAGRGVALTVGPNTLRREALLMVPSMRDPLPRWSKTGAPLSSPPRGEGCETGVLADNRAQGTSADQRVGVSRTPYPQHFICLLH